MWALFFGVLGVPMLQSGLGGYSIMGILYILILKISYGYETKDAIYLLIFLMMIDFMNGALRDYISLRFFGLM